MWHRRLVCIPKSLHEVWRRVAPVPSVKQLLSSINWSSWLRSPDHSNRATLKIASSTVAWLIPVQDNPEESGLRFHQPNDTAGKFWLKQALLTWSIQIPCNQLQLSMNFGNITHTANIPLARLFSVDDPSKRELPPNRVSALGVYDSLHMHWSMALWEHYASRIFL